MAADIRTLDAVSKTVSLLDEDGEPTATLRITVEFGDLLGDDGIEKIPEFFDVTAKSFELMMAR